MTRLYHARKDAETAMKAAFYDASLALGRFPSAELQKAVTNRAWQDQVSAREAILRCAAAGLDAEGFLSPGRTCSFPDCTLPATRLGLCRGHYTQHLRGKDLKPLRRPAAGRISVRLSETALAALGPNPAVQAREILERWAAQAKTR